MKSWHSVYNAADINSAHNNFIQIIHNLLCKCCPIIIIKLKRKTADKPWMTTGLKNSRKKKKLLYIAFIKIKTHQDEFKYKNNKNKLTLTAKNANSSTFLI